MSENKEKILETAMLAALNYKRYVRELLKENHLSEKHKQAYKIACSNCVSACKRLFAFYKGEGEK